MEESNGLAAIIGSIVYLGIAIVAIVSMWKVFEKAGKPGWGAIVPIYNIILLLEIVGKPAWWIVLFFVPLANLYAAFMITNLLAKSFGKSTGFGLGILFLGIIFYPMLAFGDAKYHGPAGLEKV